MQKPFRGKLHSPFRFISSLPSHRRLKHLPSLPVSDSRAECPEMVVPAGGRPSQRRPPVPYQPRIMASTEEPDSPLQQRRVHNPHRPDSPLTIHLARDARRALVSSSSLPVCHRAKQIEQPHGYIYNKPANLVPVTQCLDRDAATVPGKKEGRRGGGVRRRGALPECVPASDGSP